MKHIRIFEEFVNEGLTDKMVGKSKEDIFSSIKANSSSYTDIFYDVSNQVDLENLDDPLQYLNELKSYAIKQENAFVVEVMTTDWTGSVNLDSYSIGGISSEEIRNAIYETIRKYYQSYFDDKEEYKEEHEKMRSVVERIDENTILDDINDIVYNSDDLPINIFYKIGDEVHTIQYSDKILKYSK